MIWVSSLDNRRLRFLRQISFFAGIVIILAGIFLEIKGTIIIDPLRLRIALGGLVFLIILVSYISAWARRNYQLLVYGFILAGFTWAEYLLYLNQLNPIHALNYFILLLGCSLVMDDRRILGIYLLIALTSGSVVAFAINGPAFPPLAFAVEGTIIAFLAFISVSNFLISRTEALIGQGNFKTLADNTNAALFLVDSDFKIIETNDRAERQFRSSSGAVPGDDGDVLDFIPEDYREDFRDDCITVISNRQSFEKQQKLKFHSGEELWFEIKGVPVISGQRGKSITALIEFRDIDRSMRSAETIQAQNRELQKVNSELDMFVYRVAHDLRSPIASMLGLIHVSELDKDPNSAGRILQMMKDSALRLDHFIGEIMDYLQNARKESDNLEVDFHNIIQDALMDHRFLHGYKKIKTDIGISGLAFVSDPFRIRIVLNNLISNAIKYHDYSRKRPFLKIIVETDSTGASMRISDNGKGISPADQEKVFNMFYRAHDDSKGSGLGLYMVKEIIDKLGGKIKVDSKVNQGTTISLFIPNGPVKRPESAGVAVSDESH